MKLVYVGNNYIEEPRFGLTYDVRIHSQNDFIIVEWTDKNSKKTRFYPYSSLREFKEDWKDCIKWKEYPK